MRKLIIVVLIFVNLAGCGPLKDSPPSPTPTAITSGFIGPVLGGGDDTGSCEEGSSCSVTVGTVEMDDAPLSLVQQQAGPFNIGIPEGYSALIMPDGILISPLSPDTDGGFKVILRQVDDQSLAGILTGFNQPDFASGTPLETGSMNGHMLPTRDYGAIALLQTEDGRQIFVEASAANGSYWNAFRATFEAMLASLSP